VYTGIAVPPITKSRQIKGKIKMTDKKASPAIPVNNDEWVTISDANTTSDIKMVFEVVGDTFIGTYLGLRTIPTADGSFKQARFSDDNGGTYFTNANFSLLESLAKVRTGSMVRIIYIDDLDTGQVNPMRIFQVDVSRPKRAAMQSGVRPGNIVNT
jgi:hypothetical protein